MSKPEILRCPCCGNFPLQKHDCFGYYWYHCDGYACDFPDSIEEYGKIDAIKAWNEAVNKYKEAKDG